MLLSGSDQIWNPKIFPDGRFDPVFFGAFSHKRKIAYAPSFGIPRIPERHGGGAADLSGVPSPISSVRERQGQGIVRDITGKDVPGGAGSHAAAGESGLGGRGHGTEARAGAISSAIASAAPTPWHPISAAWRRRRGCRWCSCAAYARRSTPRPAAFSDAGPAEFLGLFPGCRLCVHQLLPRDGVLRPVPKALLHGGGTGRDGCAGELPHLQPA